MVKASINREKVTRGHLRELMQKKKTIIKDAYILEKFRQRPYVFFVLRINGPEKRVIDQCCSWNVYRLLISPTRLKKLILSDRINHIDPSCIDNLKKDCKSKLNIKEILDRYSYQNRSLNTHVCDWTYYKYYYEVSVNPIIANPNQIIII